MGKEPLFLGFDIGGTKIGIGLGDASGRIFFSSRLNNVDTDPDEMLPLLAATAKAEVAKAGFALNDVTAFGISAPFPADAVRGIMTAPPNNPRWRNVPILSYLTQQLGRPGCFENDANCGALAEWLFGAGQGCDNLIYLTMSTGIGGGIISDGRLVRGGGTLSAGEVGHTCVEIDGRQCNCGLKGCYEAYAGGRAVAERLREELPDHPDSLLWKLIDGDLKRADMAALAQAVREHDAYALKLWDEIARRNAQAMGALINLLDPERLILGTMAWAIGDLYMDPIKKYLPQFCWSSALERCELLPSALRREIGAYAGIAAALNHWRETGCQA